MSLHVVSLPYSQTTAAWQTCAYTSKTVKFCRMMTAAGYQVILYSGGENDAVCAEHVTVVTAEQRHTWYGELAPDELIAGPVNRFDEDLPWLVMNAQAVAEISKRIEPGDIVCLTAGRAQRLLADAFPGHLCVESGVGYEGICTDFCCFESYTWMHYVYGRQGWTGGRWYDAVIPNFFDPAEFPENASDGYLLFIGRLSHNGGLNKGLAVAVEIAARAGRKLLIAGPGASDWQPGRLIADGQTYEGDIDYLGVLGRNRGDVMSRAHALLAPTTYIEPFGGAAVEAQLCGVPVVATDWGAFTETVEDGVAGFRFRTVAEGATAVDRIAGLDRGRIRADARAAWSLDAVGPRYDAWFRRLDGLHGEGWAA